MQGFVTVETCKKDKQAITQNTKAHIDWNRDALLNIKC